MFVTTIYAIVIVDTPQTHILWDDVGTQLLAISVVPQNFVGTQLLAASVVPQNFGANRGRSWQASCPLGGSGGLSK